MKRMSKKRVKIFYLPFNREVIFGLVALVILISLGVTDFDGSRLPEESSVFTAQIQPYYRGSTDTQKVALKINVAWGEDYLPKVLNILQEKNVEGTFFLLGRWVEKFPQLTEEIKDQGHEIGNHGFYHSQPTQLTDAELRELIKKNERLIEEVTGKRTDLFAPPYGEVNEEVVQVAEELGYKTILWSADTIDWQRPEPEIIIERALDKIDAGGIILLHPTKPTVEALPQIIDKLREQGYELVTISELIE